MGWCSKKRLPADKHIVIIGAGFAGLQLAEDLLNYENANFTLINLRDEFHQNVAGCRAAIVDGLAQKTLIPLKPVFGDHFKRGRVISVNPEDKSVHLESGEVIKYSILVICTGTGGPFPFKISKDHTTDEAIDSYKKCVQKISESHTYVVVGGGATGCEMAAELASAYPKKSVTLITSGKQLIPDISVEKFKNKVKDIIKGKGVKIIFNERVTNLDEVLQSENKTVVTNQGTRIEADCVLNCMGLRVNTDAYEGSLAHVMDKQGRLRVNEFLQVEGYNDIFALGDCCDTVEAKIGYVAGLQGTWLASQLMDYFDGKKINPYSIGGAPVQMLVALGPDAGLGVTKGGWIIPSFLSVIFKGNLLVPETWKRLKQKMPE